MFAVTQKEPVLLSRKGMAEQVESRDPGSRSTSTVCLVMSIISMP